MASCVPVIVADTCRAERLLKLRRLSRLCNKIRWQIHGGASDHSVGRASRSRGQLESYILCYQIVASVSGSGRRTHRRALLRVPRLTVGTLRKSAFKMRVVVRRNDVVGWG